MLPRLLLKSVLPISSLGLILACGVPADPSEGEDPNGQTLNQIGEVGLHAVQDPSCQEQGQPTSIDSYGGWIWRGESVVHKSFKAAQIASINSLSSRSVMATWYGQRQEEDCQLIAGSLSCASDARVTQNSRSLKICQKDAVYERESVEGVAMTGVHQIDLAWSYYRLLDGAKAEISRSNLLVLPEIRQIYEVSENGTNQPRSYVLSSNLAYVASFKNAPTFVIYPTALRDAPQGSPTRANLWESSWGMAHEFGHHVLRTHSGRSGFNPNSLTAKGAVEVHDFDHAPETNFHVSSFELTSSPRTVTAKDHWQAINEGFADLFAFYSLNQRPELAKNISCMDISRDVTSQQFANGRLKALDAAALASFSSSQFEVIENCNEPNFQTPHSVGAVIAYGVNRLFQASWAVEREGIHHAGVLLLKWAEQLRSATGSGTSPIELSTLVKLAVVVAADDNRALTQAQCDVVKTVFPQWQSDWLGQMGRQGNFYCR